MIALFVTGFMSGCAPVVATHCSVALSASGLSIATITVENRSSVEIRKTTVLVDTRVTEPGGGNRLFETTTPVAPKETRTIAGYEPGQFDFEDKSQLFHRHFNGWEFKDAADARRGCELDQVVFSDGTQWEQPSPL